MPKYDIKESNISLLGSDIEKRVRENAGDKEPAWDQAGKTQGLEIWRIEQFKVILWPKEKHGSFYDGDSYICLHTHKIKPNSEELSYDLHFWLGENTSQDEAGTAAFKTVELDDHLHGRPVQYREIQGHESQRFLSYFKNYLCLHGGVSTGFHHVSARSLLEKRKLYQIKSVGLHLTVREVPAEGTSIHGGSVFVLDRGDHVWQFNTRGCPGKERFKAAEFVRDLIDKRLTEAKCDLTVYDEGGPGATIFLAEFGLDSVPHQEQHVEGKEEDSPLLFRLSDSTGSVSFEKMTPADRSSLQSTDAFLLDDSSNSKHRAVYIWLGNSASLTERRLALQYAQNYLHRNKGREEVSIIRVSEDDESEAFARAIERRHV